MLNRFDVWQYRKDSNCFDFVREWLIYKGVPAQDLPKQTVDPKDKKGMTEASIPVIKNLHLCQPQENAIACHYMRHYGKEILYHVGIVDCGKVRHVSSKMGLRCDSIEEFESMSRITKYYAHEKLWLQ